MKRSAIVISALLALTASAGAADLGWNSAPATSPMYSSTSAVDWNGFYAGVNGGYAFGNAAVSPVNANTNNNSSGWVGGIQAGVNADMGGFVLGGEADFQLSNLGYNEPANPGPGTFEAKLDSFGTIRGRAGVTFGQVMPYATLGAAFGRGTAQVVNGAVTTSQSATHFGWTAGLGLEAKATDNISVKAEYMYVDLGSQSYGARDVGHKFSVIRAGVNYSF